MRDTEWWKWVKVVLEILLIAAIIWGCIFVYTSFGFAYADEYIDEGYVLCADYVNVRRSASRKSECIGRFECGDMVYLDGNKKNGFLHCVNLSLEEDSGWIYKGFVVYDEPERMNRTALIVSKGRLAARKYVNGRRTRWLKPMGEVKVYWWSDSWAVTNCGYVQTKYLELEGM